MTQPEIVMVPLSKIKPNTWRDFVLNPIDTEQVELLKESIEATKEFWAGVYGRKAGDFVELAFGHCRLEAAKAKGLKSIPIVLRELSDADMLMRMAKENEEGNMDFRTALEAVAAAVRALAEGKIRVPAPDPSTRKDAIRYAPSFVPGRETPALSESARPYTAATLAKFLGGIYVRKDRGQIAPQNSVVAALGALECIERRVDLGGDKVITPRFFDGMPLMKIASEANRLIRRHEEDQQRRVLNVEDLNKLKAQQREADRKAEEAEKEAENARIAKRLADAVAKKAKEDADKQEEKRLAKEALDLAEEKAKEAAAAVVVVAKRTAEQEIKNEQEEKRAEERAAYDSTLRDVRYVIGHAGRIAEEHGALWDMVKNLRKSNITLPDRDKVMAAFREAGRRCDIMANLMEVSLKNASKLIKSSKEKQ